MELYLPIAQMSVNPFLIIGMGIGIGIMSGLFGVGGGFLLTPLLFMVGIPPAIAVGTSANQIMASSISAVLAHFRDGNVDVKMGTVLTIGGFLGSIVGVYILNILIAMGNVDAAIKIFYVVFLGGVGAMMLPDIMKSRGNRVDRFLPRGLFTIDLWIKKPSGSGMAIIKRRAFYTQGSHIRFIAGIPRLHLQQATEIDEAIDARPQLA